MSVLIFTENKVLINGCVPAIHSCSIPATAEERIVQWCNTCSMLVTGILWALCVATDLLHCCRNGLWSCGPRAIGCTCTPRL